MTEKRPFKAGVCTSEVKKVRGYRRSTGWVDAEMTEGRQVNNELKANPPVRLNMLKIMCWHCSPWQRGAMALKGVEGRCQASAEREGFGVQL